MIRLVAGSLRMIDMGKRVKFKTGKIHRVVTLHSIEHRIGAGDTPVTLINGMVTDPYGFVEVGNQKAACHDH